MEIFANLSSPPGAPATNYTGGLKAASVLPTGPACSAAITTALRVLHVPVQPPPSRLTCTPMSQPAPGMTCQVTRNLVRDNPHQQAARHDGTSPASLNRATGRNRELEVTAS